MVGSSLSGYIHGLIIDKKRNTKWSKIALISSFIISIGLLGFFKYSDFFIENINNIFKSEISLLRISLPIGISFYTFQILSYNIDVYKNEAKVQKSFIKFATYVALFPQLIAGPIVRYTTIEEQLTYRVTNIDNISSGMKRFIIGLGKKVLIANTLAEVSNIFLTSSEKSVLFYWIVAITFTLHIYFDFSGYSDMAIGLGKIFGFDFLENFNYPYISTSITDFWRRWHISLSTWFRDYVYIPLGGNRCSKLKWIRNVLVVWFLTGFWHGAEWNFIIWGLYFGIILLLEKLVFHKVLPKLPKFIKHIYTLFLVIIGFVIFNATSLTDVLTSLEGMFGLLDIPLSNFETIYYLKSYLVVTLVAIVGATPLMKTLIIKIKNNQKGEKVLTVLEPIFCLILLLAVTASLVDGSFNPFLYFRF